MDRADMTQMEILEELTKLPITERLTIIETVLHRVCADLQSTEQPTAQTGSTGQLAAAAAALLPAYEAGGELTIFTALDSEDFHAEG